MTLPLYDLENLPGCTRSAPAGGSRSLTLTLETNGAFGNAGGHAAPRVIQQVLTRMAFPAAQNIRSKLTGGRVFLFRLEAPALRYRRATVRL